MMDGIHCVHCESDLRLAKEIHVVMGEHFCSKECAIQHLTNENIMNAKALAIEHYNDCAEVVTPIDIGMVYEKIRTAYSSDIDMTTIILQKFIDEDCEEPLSTEVIGMYWGEPNDEDTHKYTGIIRHTY